MHRCFAFVAITTSLSTLACGAADQTPEKSERQATQTTPDGGLASLAGAGSHAPASEVEATHEFVVGDTEYALVETSAREFLLLGASAASVVKPPHAVLTEQHGRLTLLELFLALAPDQQPNERLVDYHHIEVQALDRADSSIRQVDYTPPLIGKAVTGQDCYDYAVAKVDALSGVDPYAAWWFNKQTDSNGYVLYFGDRTRDAEALTACNPHWYYVSYSFGWSYENDAPQWFNWKRLYSNWKAFVVGGVIAASQPRRRHWLEVKDMVGGDAILMGKALGN